MPRWNPLCWLFPNFAYLLPEAAEALDLALVQPAPGPPRPPGPPPGPPPRPSRRSFLRRGRQNRNPYIFQTRPALSLQIDERLRAGRETVSKP
jgi:hypothetical protein